MSKQKINISPVEYTEASFIAREVGEQMIARLDLMALQPNIIVDLGCSLGYEAERLCERYPGAKVFAVDNDKEMLHQARKIQSKEFNLICADAQLLPFSDQSVDLIFANLLMPWCLDIEKLFTEWRRILRPDGLLMFATLGPDTLLELQEKIPSTCLPNLIDMHLIGDGLTKTRFADPVLDVEYLTVTYRNKSLLFQELYHSGMLSELPCAVELEKNANDVFPITYEIVYGHAWGPDPGVDYIADERGEIKIPLAHLRMHKK
jgi:malonyl-CoA O-methyltransferase